MSNARRKKTTVEEPAIEVVVRSRDAELAVIAFFEDGEDGWDVLVGVGDPTDRNALAASLVAASDAVLSAAFHPTPTNQHEGGFDAPPF